MSAEIQAALDESPCLDCLEMGQLLTAEIYLLCEWANL